MKDVPAEFPGNELVTAGLVDLAAGVRERGVVARLEQPQDPIRAYVLSYFLRKNALG
jgi:hypothetical protein